MLLWLDIITLISKFIFNITAFFY